MSSGQERVWYDQHMRRHIDDERVPKSTFTYQGEQVVRYSLRYEELLQEAMEELKISTGESWVSCQDPRLRELCTPMVIEEPDGASGRVDGFPFGSNIYSSAEAAEMIHLTGHTKATQN